MRIIKIGKTAEQVFNEYNGEKCIHNGIYCKIVDNTYEAINPIPPVIEYTEEELKFIDSVEIMFIENARDILDGDDNGEVTKEPLSLIPDNVFLVGGRLSFPYFLEDGEEKTYYPLKIWKME